MLRKLNSEPACDKSNDPVQSVDRRRTSYYSRSRRLRGSLSKRLFGRHPAFTLHVLLVILMWRAALPRIFLSQHYLFSAAISLNPRFSLWFAICPRLIMCRGVYHVREMRSCPVLVPPGPLHVRSNRVDVASGPTVSLPAVGRNPDQPRLAWQLVAPTTDHCNKAVWPVARDSGVAPSVIFGGVSTDTATILVALPSCPEHVRLKVVFDEIGADVSEPTGGRVPVHPPLA